MPITADQFLRHWRFSAAPFPAFTAEQEGSALTPVFLPQPWFRDELVGNPWEPRSCIVYGDRGSGKSAHRMELRRIASSFREGRALVVTLDDRGAMPGGDRPIAEYVDKICRLTLLELDSYLADRLDALPRHSYDLLWLYWKAYAPECAIGRRPASPDSEQMYGLVNHGDGLRSTLQRLNELIRALGFASVYMLLDSLDEGLGAGDLAPLAGALRPLISNPRLLQGCGFAFKFFLPTELRALLSGQDGRWLERMPEHEIAHRGEDLQAILNRRLETSSAYGPTIAGGYVSRFAQLCVPDGSPEDDEALALEALLVRAAEGSPRALLRLADQVIRQHCASAARPGEPIGRAAVEAALGGLPARPLSLNGAAPAPRQARPAPAAEPPAPQPSVGPLRFCDDGQVLIGGRAVTRLNGMLYRAMKILWDHRGGLVRYAQIEQELYGDDLDERGNPRSSREKLIRRLRKKLEEHNPDASVSRAYIDITEGIGLALRNYEEENVA